MAIRAGTVIVNGAGKPGEPGATPGMQTLASEPAPKAAEAPVAAAGAPSNITPPAARPTGNPWAGASPEEIAKATGGDMGLDRVPLPIDGAKLHAGS